MSTLAVGLGCDRGTPLVTVMEALTLALQQVEHTQAQVRICATITAKSDEVGLLDLAKLLGVPLQFFSAAELNAVPVANPSATVLRFMGTASVSEAAAILAANHAANYTMTHCADPSDPKKNSATVLLEKFKYRGACGKHATISIAKIPS